MVYNFRMKRKIVHFPNPILKKKAKAVKWVTPEVIRLVNDMLETMRAAPGIGLAAPQVGVLLRVIVAEINDETGPVALINPKIIARDGEQTYTEGCLSLPGVEAPVKRASTVVARGWDKSGQEIEVIAKGLLATVLQHEIDHLDGKVFIDRVADPSTIKHRAFDKEKKEELI